MAQTSKQHVDEEILRLAERAKSDRAKQKENVEEFLSNFEKEYRARINERKKVAAPK